MSCDRSVDVGAYVLGALDPAARSALEQHLPTCAACRAALAELAGLPGLLSRLTPAEAESVGAVPPRVLDGLLARAARRRTGRLRVVGVAAGAVALALAGTGVALDHRGPHAEVRSASAGAVHARASLTAVDAGTRISLSLQGVPPEERCRLVAVTTGGAQIDGGSWYASYQGHAGVTSTAAAEPAELHDLRIETLDGRLLVDIPLQT